MNIYDGLSIKTGTCMKIQEKKEKKQSQFKPISAKIIMT